MRRARVVALSIALLACSSSSKNDNNGNGGGGAGGAAGAGGINGALATFCNEIAPDCCKCAEPACPETLGACDDDPSCGKIAKCAWQCNEPSCVDGCVSSEPSNTSRQKFADLRSCTLSKCPVPACFY
jgi:hypothetical protein